MQTWLAKQRQFIIAAMIFSLFGTGAAFALPYTPQDAELNPTCAPGSTDCYVSVLAIGNTVTSGTSGSLLFAGTSGALSQDNTNLYFDDTNNRLSIGGDTSPEATLDITGAGSTSATLSLSLSTSTREFLRVQNNEVFHTKGKVIIDNINATGDWTDFWTQAKTLGMRGAIYDTETYTQNMHFGFDIYGSSAVSNKSYTNAYFPVYYQASSTTTASLIAVDTFMYMPSGTTGTIASMKNFNAGSSMTFNIPATISNYYSYYAGPSRQGATVTNYYGFYVTDSATIGSTGNYGIYVATNNLSNYFAGKVGIGTDTTPDAMIDIVGTGSTSSTLTASLSNTTREFFRIYDDEHIFSRGKLIIENYFDATDVWTDLWTDTTGLVVSSEGTDSSAASGPKGMQGILSISGSSTTSNKSYEAFRLTANYFATSTTTNYIEGMRNSIVLQTGATGTIAETAAYYSAYWQKPTVAAVITNAYGYYADFLKQGTGAITNYYAFYAVEHSNATTNSYGIYIADADYSNYLAYRLGIGSDTTPDYLLEVEGDTADYVARLFNDGNATTRNGLLISAGVDDHTAASTSTLIGFQDGDGTTVGSITFGSSATAYNTTSDQRLKENIRDTNLSLDDLMRIQVRDYNFIADVNKKTSQGFIAQELLQVYPAAVTVPTNPEDYMMVDYSKLMPLAIKSIQDLNLKLENLRASVEGNGSLAQNIGEFVVGILKATRIETQTASITNGLEMTDKATGTIYCVVINNGEWLKTAGSCSAEEQVDSSSNPPVEEQSQAPEESAEDSVNEPPQDSSQAPAETPAETP